jgi:hypothetical protein
MNSLLLRCMYSFGFLLFSIVCEPYLSAATRGRRGENVAEGSVIKALPMMSCKIALSYLALPMENQTPTEVGVSATEHKHAATIGLTFRSGSIGLPDCCTRWRLDSAE